MLKRIILLILCIFLSDKVFAENSCKLISNLNSDLWLVDHDGSPIKRLTINGILKSAATFSPDGQYIAYSCETEIGKEKAIIIIDNTGQEISKIIVEPKTDDPNLQWIKGVYRLVWDKSNVLWSYSSVGRFGGFIDIWSLDASMQASHKKRIEAMGWGCEFSPDKQHLACIVESFGIGMKESIISIEISNTRKKEISEFNFFKDSYFHDKNPRTIKLKTLKHIDNIRFTSDSANIIITGRDKKYKFNMKNNKLSKIKELPAGVKIKTIPQRIKVKKDEKEYSAEVFDMFCDQPTNTPK